MVCAAAAAAVLLLGGSRHSVTRAVGAAPSPAVLAFTARTRGSAGLRVFALRRNGTVSPLGNGPGRAVSWSPGGRELLIIHPTPDLGGAEALDALDTATGRVRPLWRATTIEAAAWSPDGRYIAVEWDRKVSILGRDGEVVRALGEQVPAGPASQDGLAWSDDGHLAVTYATPGGSGIAIEQPRGVIPRIMSPCGRERPCHGLLRPDWASGSDALAMVRTRAGHSDAWWWTGHGPPERLPSRGRTGNVLSAAWAPDGHRLALGTANGVAVMAGPGAPAVGITATAPVAGPAWSADGRRLAVATRSHGGPYVLDVLVLGPGGGPARLETSSVFERIAGPLVWNPAG